MHVQPSAAQHTPKVDAAAPWGMRRHGACLRPVRACALLPVPDELEGMCLRAVHVFAHVACFISASCSLSLHSKLSSLALMLEIASNPMHKGAHSLMIEVQSVMVPGDTVIKIMKTLWWHMLYNYIVIAASTCRTLTPLTPVHCIILGILVMTAGAQPTRLQCGE